MPPSTPNQGGRPAAERLAWITFVVIGWIGLLGPALIRSIKDAFDQTDAGIGLFYFVYAMAYATGSLGGGFVTERFGRRAVLTGAAAAAGVGLGLMGLGPTWAIFLLGAVPTAMGAGALDGGVNGLVLDLVPSGRGRSLNVLHAFFSVGALSAPLVVGRLVDAGVAWTAILVVSGLVALAVAVGFSRVAMPDGRSGSVERVPVASDGPGGNLLAGPLILLAVAIGLYVASEVGVTNWLVRFLEPAPLTTATTALGLFWVGLALGRLVASRIADRFDHVRFAASAAAAMAALFLGAIAAPSLELSIALFTLAGFATGPVFPMIIAIGGDRYPGRTSAVSGILTGAAVSGSIVYPPIMGFLSVTVGLPIAMTGGALLGFASAAALLLVEREPTTGDVPAEAA